MRNVLEEVEVEIISNSLMKLWLQDFYRYCEDIGGDTATIMCELLAARADRHAINITLNSFGGPLNDPQMRGSDRHRLYPAIGTLYPECSSKFTDVTDDMQLAAALEPYPVYREIWAMHVNESFHDKSIDDAFFERDAEMLELAFEGQMHFGCFYVRTLFIYILQSPPPRCTERADENDGLLLPYYSPCTAEGLSEAQGTRGPKSCLDF